MSPVSPNYNYKMPCSLSRSLNVNVVGEDSNPHFLAVWHEVEDTWRGKVQMTTRVELATEDEQVKAAQLQGTSPGSRLLVLYDVHTNRCYKSLIIHLTVYQSSTS
jgi:hypothetical protein